MGNEMYIITLKPVRYTFRYDKIRKFNWIREFIIVIFQCFVNFYIK